MSVILVSSLFSIGLFVPSFASPYALQNPSGTVNATNATSGNTNPTPTNTFTGTSTGAITVTTDRTSYRFGDTITISGSTQDYITDTPITVIVKNPLGNIAKFDQIPLGSDRTYSYSINANTPQWQSSGTYSVMVQFGSQDRTAQTTFQFTGSSGDTSTPPSPSTILSVTTDLPSYKTGDTIIMSGHITNLQGSTSITIRVFNSLKNLVVVDQLLPSADGSFNHVLGSRYTQSWLVSGTYTIVTQYSLYASSTITFQFTAQTTPTPSHSPYAPCPDCNGTSNTQPTPVTPSPSPVNSTTAKIPNWVKGVFGFYAEGKLSSNDLIQALQFLIQQGIIHVPTVSVTPSTTTNSTTTVPNWVKGIFNFYAQGDLSDDDLVKALQFLVQQGVIRLS